jgi:hypothetical protein
MAREANTEAADVVRATHIDQAIMVGSLIIGLWFIADSLYLIVS